MAGGRFTARIPFDLWRQASIPKGRGYLLVKVADEDYGQIKEMLRVYEQDAVKQAEKGEQPREIAFLWDVAYGKRKLSLNNLTWAILTLTAALMNEGMPEGKPKLTPTELYNQDMGQVAPCRGIECEQDQWQWLEEAGAKVKAVVPIEKTTRVIAYVVKTSSKWNDVEAHKYIEFLFNRLAMMGIPLPADQVKLKGWWLDWMMDIEEHRFELHGDVLSKDQYRELHPLCEGCMAFIGMGGGQLTHIKSAGAGGEEPQLASGAEWLHLCAQCHLGVVHAKGWGKFKKLRPHLAGKIDRALEKPALGSTAEVAEAAKSGMLFGPEDLREKYDDDPNNPLI